MKMKSKFFGFTAKLAMAILAVGTMFTSCYDSENGDVSKPYKAPDAVYTFVVTVSNGITGKPVEGATVTAGSTACAGVGNGVYQAVVTNDQTGTKMPSTVTVSVAAVANAYEAATATVNVATIENGQAITCYANIIVNPTKYEPEGLKVETSSNTTAVTGSLSGDKNYADNNPETVKYEGNLDIINTSDDPMQVTKNITVYEGIKYTQEPTMTRADMDITSKLKEYIASVEGPITGFTTAVRPYSFLLPAKSALQSISIQYLYDDKTFNFTYGNDSYVAKTRRVVSVIFSNTPVLTEMYHGHGHGHGHGGDLNAGGGIFE
mgnify:CR=1 FL=1